MSKTNINTFSELYELAQTHIEVFDLGRQLQHIDSDDLYKIEVGELPYPYPFKESAHIAIITWHPDHPERHSIWMFKWALDERNMVQISAQQNCLERVIKSLAVKDEDERRRLLQDHPFHFKPNEIMQSCFHAKASIILNQPVSKFYESSKQYYLSESQNNWQEIGIQGVGELVWRLQDSDKKHIVKHFNDYAKPAQLCLLACLEHSNDDPIFSQQLIKQVQLDEFELFSHLIRAVSKTANDPVVKNWLHLLVNEHTELHIECLLAIATRAYLALEDDIVMINLFHKLAQISNIKTIDIIAKDLTRFEPLRKHVIKALRVPIN
ncbi:MAG: DUF3549 family protein [Saccharospirillaceae bacterium]|nr:DUF3549 family protein [Pseudomonadales bacterium]NRB77533.1 DUF3549 family protein [Saccharospirillaceae bacterium]